MKKVSGARNLLHNIDVQQTVLQLLAATTSNYSLHSLTSDIAFECGVNVKVWVKKDSFVTKWKDFSVFIIITTSILNSQNKSKAWDTKGQLSCGSQLIVSINLKII